MVNVVAFCSDPSKEGTKFSESSSLWVTDVDKDELLEQYAGWEDEVIRLLKARYSFTPNMKRRLTYSS